MDEGEIELRNVTYALFVELGRAPTREEAGRRARLTPERVQLGWQRLHHAHALVLNSAISELRMVNPFSAVPTANRVWARDRWWFANCAWDAFGILGALHSDGRIETVCADCGEPIALEIRRQRPDDETLVFHCLPQARRWWDDIVFT